MNPQWTQIGLQFALLLGPPAGAPVTNGSAWTLYEEGCPLSPLVGDRLFYPEVCRSPRYACRYLDGSPIAECEGCWCGISAWADESQMLLWPWPEWASVMVVHWHQAGSGTDYNPFAVCIGPADWDLSGAVDVFDLLAYLDGWFASDQDAAALLVFLDGWFAHA